MQSLNRTSSQCSQCNGLKQLLSFRVTGSNYTKPTFRIEQSRIRLSKVNFDLKTTSKHRFSFNSQCFHKMSFSTSSNNNATVFIAVGSNLGNRHENIIQSIQLMKKSNSMTNDQFNFVSTSFLYETSPLYLLNQPSYLNCMFKCTTNLQPVQLLKHLKSIESQLGRNLSPTQIRNSARPIDLDIILYQTNRSQSKYEISILHESEQLIIPHKSMHQRGFVLIPLKDIISSNQFNHSKHPSLNQTLQSLYQEWKNKQSKLDSTNSEYETLNRVLPIHHSSNSSSKLNDVWKWNSKRTFAI